MMFLLVVRGEGPTFYEVQDARGRALSKAMTQLVVAQRVVAGDELVVDKVMSTMNGFVNSFKLLSVNESDSWVDIQAETEVSESRIENFIGVVSEQIR